MNLAEPSAGRRDCPPGSDFSLEESGTILALLPLWHYVPVLSIWLQLHTDTPTFPPTEPHTNPADFRVTCPRTAQLLLDRLLLFFYVIRWHLKYEEKCLDCKQSVTSNVPHVSEHFAAGEASGLASPVSAHALLVVAGNGRLLL